MSQLLKVGKIANTHGLKGEVKIKTDYEFINSENKKKINATTLSTNKTELAEIITNIEKIIDIINHLKPFIQNDGGNIEFVKYENNIVYIRMIGACAECAMLDLTLKDGIEAAIKEEIPEVIEVINLQG